MSTYKVIQDIEAEDKLVGPLSLRQFLYAIAAIVGGYLCFLSIQKGAGFLLVVFLPITLGVGFFAVPWRKEQSTETWALAHLRFYIKPHRRIWSQNGIREYVQIISKNPRIVRAVTNGMGDDEVRSRLHALAETIDTHGWAVKGATANDLSQVDPLLDHTTSDRLVGSTPVSREAMSHMKASDDMQAHEDMLDDSHPVSQSLIGMIDRQTAERRERLIKQVAAQAKLPAAPAVGTGVPAAPGQWFVNAPGTPGATGTAVITPGTSLTATASTEPSEAERALAAQFKAQNEASQQVYYGHLHIVQPLNPNARVVKPSAESEPPVAAPKIEKPKLPVDKAATAPGKATNKPVTQKPSAAKPVKPSVPEKAAAKPAKPQDAKAPVTSQIDPAILEYAGNDDLDIATISRQINKRKSPNEVEIRLH